MKIYPLFRELTLDYETPISVFLKMTDNNSRKGFLLESKEKVESIGRYSIAGVFSGKSLSFSTDPFDPLKRILARAQVEKRDLPLPFSGGLIGYFSYDAVRHIERLDLKNPDSIRIPETLFILPEIYFVYDHFLNKSYLFTLISESGRDDEFSCSPDTGKSILDYYEKKLLSRLDIKEMRIRPSRTKVDIRSNTSREDYENAVKKAKQYIRDGDIFQTVLSQRLSLVTSNSGFNIYRNLRTINPSPYMYYFNLGDFEIIGASPEVLVKKSDEKAILKPIAGTRRRGLKPDGELEKELLSDQKELAEHTMLVDLARNDLNRVCVHETMEVKNPYSIEKYSSVIHIVSEVTGRLKQMYDSVDLFKAAFPAGTVTGAPKIRAMEIIEELETARRGLYSGAIGYFSFNGDMDFCIAIRTILKMNRQVFIQAGAGIVADSVPENEYNESLCKAQALIEAVHFEEE